MILGWQKRLLGAVITDTLNAPSFLRTYDLLKYSNQSVFLYSSVPNIHLYEYDKDDEDHNEERSKHIVGN